MKAKQEKNERRSIWATLWDNDIAFPLVVILASFILGAILMLITGVNPLIAYRVLLKASFGSLNSISETMVKACPLLLCGLGTIVAFRCKFWNIGAEGQIYAGGIMAALVGNLPLHLPALVHIPLMVLAGAVGGALFAFIPTFLKVKLKINEVITTIMFNYIAIHLVGYMVHGPMKGDGFLPMSDKLPPEACLPRLIPATRFHLGIIIALVLAGVVYFLIWKTVLGYRIRTVGENIIAARLGGINPVSVVLWAGLISGGLAGIAGMAEVGGIQTRLVEGFSPGYGYLAVAVGLVGQLKPLGVVLAAILFGALLSGSNAMQSTVGVPFTIIYVIEGFMIMVISARFLKRRVK
ncbi:MAG: ABC transporter permease [Candidatus Auribacterota bacterium]|nr:ABC transporter permease [Candidatus Auribacterota bacterium]